MKYNFLFLLMFILLKSDIPVTDAQSTVVTNTFILSGTKTTSVATGTTTVTPSTTQLATTKAVDTTVKKVVSDSIQEVLSVIPTIAKESISLTTTGTGASSYNSSTGVLNIPTATVWKRVESYSGTSNSSGVITITFGNAFSVAPNVQASIADLSVTNQFLRITSISTTGCTINVFQRSTLTVLGIDLLAAATTNVNGASVNVIVMEK